MKKEYKQILVPFYGVGIENKVGNGVPAIPCPYYFGWKLRKCRCHCGATFKQEEDYRGHYALRHILEM